MGHRLTTVQGKKLRWGIFLPKNFPWKIFLYFSSFNSFFPNLGPKRRFYLHPSNKNKLLVSNYWEKLCKWRMLKHPMLFHQSFLYRTSRIDPKKRAKICYLFVHVAWNKKGVGDACLLKHGYLIWWTGSFIPILSLRSISRYYSMKY